MGIGRCRRCGAPPRRAWTLRAWIAAFGLGCSSAFSLLAAPASAQLRGHASVTLDGAIPVRSFAERMPPMGLGFDLSGALGYGRLPISIGAAMGAAMFFPERSFERHAGLETQARAQHRMFLGHLLIRLQPVEGWIRPFLEWRVGIKTIATWVDFTVRDGFGDILYEDQLNPVTDVALSYGPVLGVDIPLHQFDVHTGSIPGWAGLTLGVRYLRGGEANHTEAHSGELVDGVWTYGQARSRTHMFMPFVGFNFQLD